MTDGIWNRFLNVIVFLSYGIVFFFTIISLFSGIEEGGWSILLFPLFVFFIGLIIVDFCYIIILYIATSIIRWDKSLFLRILIAIFSSNTTKPNTNSDDSTNTPTSKLSSEEVDKQNHLHSLVLIANEAEEKYGTVTKSLPKEIIKASSLLLEKVSGKTDQMFTKALTDKSKKILEDTFIACTKVGLSLFYVRMQFADKLSCPGENLFDPSEIERHKISNPTSKDVTKLVIDCMENGKKIDPIEKTPPYVINYLVLLTANTMLSLDKDKVFEKLNQNEKDILVASINYLIGCSYFCGVAYVYLATRPANNRL